MRLFNNPTKIAQICAIQTARQKGGVDCEARRYKTERF